MHKVSCTNIIVVGEDKALPGVIRIKATVGNRRYWILSLDIHSVKNECVCVHNIIFNNNNYYYAYKSVRMTSVYMLVQML